MQTTITTLDAADAGTVELKETIFGLEPRKDILHRMVRYQQLKRMAGTHHAQDRSEVNVTGAKTGNQKGGGGARHGDKSVATVSWWRQGVRSEAAQSCYRSYKEVSAARAAPCSFRKGKGRRTCCYR